MLLCLNFTSVLTFTTVLVVISRRCDAEQWGSEEFSLKSNTSIPTETISCEWNHKYTLSGISLAAVLILTGLFILLTAYGRRRISFFLIGIISGTIMAYFICLEERNVSTTITLISSAAAGLLVALFSSVVLYCGYFLTGLLAGCSLGVTMLLPVTLLVTFTSATLPSAIVTLCCVIQVFVTLWWRRVMLIISSAVVGSTFVIFGVDYFVENLFLITYAELRVFYSKNYPLCWHNYVLFAGWLVLIVIGIIVQFRWTGKSVQDKQYVFVYRTRSSTNYNGSTREEDQHLVCAELSNI